MKRYIVVGVEGTEGFIDDVEDEITNITKENNMLSSGVNLAWIDDVWEVCEQCGNKHQLNKDMTQR